MAPIRRERSGTAGAITFSEAGYQPAEFRGRGDMIPGGQNGEDQPVPAQLRGEGLGARHGGLDRNYDHSIIQDSLDRAQHVGSADGMVGQPAPLRWFKVRRRLAATPARRPAFDVEALKLFVILIALTAIMLLIARGIF